MTRLNIGQAAKATGISAKMIRHYEEIGLTPQAARTESGYRYYADKDLHILRFVKQARNLGFRVDSIRELLSLWLNKRRSSNKVKSLANEYLEELELRIHELLSIRASLEELTQKCHGDDRPECPILDALEAGDPLVSESSKTKAGRGRLRNR